MQTPPHPEPARQAVTADELRRNRVLKGVPAPSGNAYDIRPLNLERFALTGNLPARLRVAAMKGAAAVNELLGADEDKLSEEGAGMQGWLDRLVAEVIVTPALYELDSADMPLVDDDGRKQVSEEMIELIPPVDYRWAVAIAMGECDEDGLGRRLWGREPLSRWEFFRLEHGCATDCEHCDRLLDRFSQALR